MEVLGDVVARIAGAEDESAAAVPDGAVGIGAGVQDGAGEGFEAGEVGDDRDGADAGGEDEVSRAHDAFAAVSAADCGGPGGGGVVVGGVDEFG